MNLDALVDIAGLGRALAEVTDEPAWGELFVERISGGKSNWTFGLTNAVGQVLILRRPPAGELLPGAHDMGREVRVQRALADTSIPVPRIVLHDHGDLIGSPFYVMDKVAGHIIRGDLPVDYAEAPAEREALARGFVDLLADLHAVDPDAVGLGDYGRPAGFMERQIHRWGRQWEISKTRSIAEIEELGRRLATQIPSPQRVGIVHGDYRLDNVVVDPDSCGRINAVLDWELSTLGDPLVDLGQLMLYWRAPDEPQFSLIPGVTHLPGFPDRDAFLQRYAERSGADLSGIAFYQAFAHFKFAVIIQGVSVRSRSGALPGKEIRSLDAEIAYLGKQGLRHLRES